MKTKKAMGSEQMIKYLSALAIIVVITFVGMMSFKTVNERFCKTELSAFELKIKAIGDELFKGTVVEKTFIAPCQAQEVYFVDTARADPTLFSQPFIQDAISSGTDHNVFVVKNGQLAQSFAMDSLQMNYPYHTCVLPQHNSINVFLEKRNQGLAVVPGCVQAECTYIPVGISDDLADQIISEFVQFDCANCPETLTDGQNDRAKALNYVKLFRKYTFCNGAHSVEIKIQPDEGIRLQNFRLLEYINKSCIANLNEVMNHTFGGDSIEIEPDPLILWQFDEVSDEESVGYTLNITLNETCLPEFDATMITQTVFNGVNQPPVLDSPIADVQLAAGLNDLVNFSLLDHFSDIDNLPTDWIVTVTEQTGASGIVVTYDSENAIVSIDMSGATSTPETFTITVDDGEFQVIDSFKIDPLPIPAVSLPDVSLVAASGTQQVYDLTLEVSYAGNFNDLEFSITNEDPARVQCAITPSNKIDCNVITSSGPLLTTLNISDGQGTHVVENFFVHILPAVSGGSILTCRTFNPTDFCAIDQIMCDTVCQSQSPPFSFGQFGGPCASGIVAGGAPGFKGCRCYNQDVTACSASPTCSSGIPVNSVTCSPGAPSFSAPLVDKSFTSVGTKFGVFDLNSVLTHPSEPVSGLDISVFDINEAVVDCSLSGLNLDCQINTLTPGSYRTTVTVSDIDLDTVTETFFIHLFAPIPGGSALTCRTYGQDTCATSQIACDASCGVLMGPGAKGQFGGTCDTNPAEQHCRCYDEQVPNLIANPGLCGETPICLSGVPVGTQSCTPLAGTMNFCATVITEIGCYWDRMECSADCNALGLVNVVPIANRDCTSEPIKADEPRPGPPDGINADWCDCYHQVPTCRDGSFSCPPAPAPGIQDNTIGGSCNLCGNSFADPGEDCDTTAGATQCSPACTCNAGFQPDGNGDCIPITNCGDANTETSCNVVGNCFWSGTIGSGSTPDPGSCQTCSPTVTCEDYNVGSSATQTQNCDVLDPCGHGVCEFLGGACYTRKCKDGTLEGQCSSIQELHFCDPASFGGDSNVNPPDTVFSPASQGGSCSCSSGTATENLNTGFCDEDAQLSVCSNDPFDSGTGGTATCFCNDERVFTTAQAVFFRHNQIPGNGATGNNKWFHWNGSQFKLQIDDTKPGTSTSNVCWSPARGITTTFPFVTDPTLNTFVNPPTGIWQGSFSLNGNLIGNVTFKIN